MGKIADKAMEVSDTLDAQARAKYIQQVMEWEECDYEEAYYLCIGRTDPKEPKYTLGYKMSSPVWAMAMFGQLRKKKREQARENFKQLLDPDELELFEKELDADAATEEFKHKYKEEKKNKGVKE